MRKTPNKLYSLSRIGVRELRESLSDKLQMVKEQGRSYVVTSHDECVAKIVPATENLTLSEVLEQLVEQRQLSWRGGKPKGLTPSVKVEGAPVSDAVSEDRR